MGLCKNWLETMKLNIAYPATGCQKLIEIEDDRKLRVFFDKKMAQEVPGDSLGDEWKGYVFRIGGGNDKQGFPMMQGVLTNGRVRLLLGAQHSCYRPRRTGQRHRRSVRGCIVAANLSVLPLIIVKKGEAEIPGLTDTTIPRRLGPKRAGKIRKLFNLNKDDDVRQYVVRRPLKLKEGQEKPKTKAPKIQRTNRHESPCALGWVFKVRLSWPGYFKNRSILSIHQFHFSARSDSMDPAAYIEKITLPWCLVSVPNLVQVALIGYEAPSGYMPGTGIRTCHPFSPCPSHVLCVPM